MDNKNRNKKEKLVPKNEENSGWEAQINTQKLNWYVVTLMEVFLNHKRINVCEDTVKMMPHDCKIYKVSSLLVNQ